ncbi:hypothetical protein AX16_004724 [Volvariella volvacea WC 439]|nr:hypothetical protein AX16_004724 [Volvariella volvacea WC 439]
MHSTSPVFRLIPTAQQYDWGKVGSSSKVAQFAAASRIPDFVLDESAPYAELWMGTHPRSPSKVLASGETLASHLQKHPDLIGKPIIDKFDAANGNLPFLFKVLAIEKALSIQTHPDKKTAEVLHAQQPDIYKDPNHKPEMALAITPFKALCGFLPLPRIATYLNSTPEFASLIPHETVSAFLSLSNSQTPTGSEEKSILKQVFEAVMTAEESVFKAKLEALVKRYESGEARKDGEDEDVVELVLRLNSQFPGDIGVFCAFMLNYVSLQPGEAIFLGAGEPHAYVSGDIMECMANSDNVIRAGLTPKLRDIPNLVSGLTYEASPPSKHVVSPSPLDPSSSPSSSLSSSSLSASQSKSTLYDPPIPEFSVIQTVVRAGGAAAVHRAIEGPSVAIVTSERGGVVRWGREEEWEEMSVGKGDVVFVGAGVGVEFRSEAGGEEEGEFVVYRAFVEA